MHGIVITEKCVDSTSEMPHRKVIIIGNFSKFRIADTRKTLVSFPRHNSIFGQVSLTNFTDDSSTIRQRKITIIEIFNDLNIVHKIFEYNETSGV